MLRILFWNAISLVVCFTLNLLIEDATQHFNIRKLCHVISVLFQLIFSVRLCGCEEIRFMVK